MADLLDQPSTARPELSAIVIEHRSSHRQNLSCDLSPRLTLRGLQRSSPEPSTVSLPAHSSQYNTHLARVAVQT